jgi:acyl-ACP thioesterase
VSSGRGGPLRLAARLARRRDSGERGPWRGVPTLNGVHSTAHAPTRIEVPVRVRFDEAGPDGKLRSSGLLRYVQDVAWIHSEGAGFGRDWYGERELMWLVRSIVLDVEDAVEYGTTLSVSTEVLGFRRVWARRRSEVARADEPGSRVATVLIDWVLLGPNGAPTRVPSEILGAFPVELPSFEPTRVALPSADDAVRHTLSVRPRDLDPMAHVNNAVYLDYLEEGVEQAGGADLLTRLPRRYRLEYILPAEPGAHLRGDVGRIESGCSYRLGDESGRELFRGVVESAAGQSAVGESAVGAFAVGQSARER